MLLWAFGYAITTLALISPEMGGVNNLTKRLWADGQARTLKKRRYSLIWYHTPTTTMTGRGSRKPRTIFMESSLESQLDQSEQVLHRKSPVYIPKFLKERKE